MQPVVTADDQSNFTGRALSAMRVGERAILFQELVAAQNSYGTAWRAYGIVEWLARNPNVDPNLENVVARYIKSVSDGSEEIPPTTLAKIVDDVEVASPYSSREAKIKAIVVEVMVNFHAADRDFARDFWDYLKERFGADHFGDRKWFMENGASSSLLEVID